MEEQKLQTVLTLTITYKSSPNIAWVKYWGKYDQKNIIPYNDNIGLTLNSDHINTITTITFSKQQPKNILILNQQEHPLSNRIVSILKKVKDMVKSRKYTEIKQEQWNLYHFRIQSKNSFPTASGLASSASGLACLVAALNGLFGQIFTNSQVSQLARRGSGSASRSIYGGLVKWYGIPIQISLNMIKKQFSIPTQSSLTKQQQTLMLNKLCISKTVVPAGQLDYISIFILLENQKKKDISSTFGMQLSMKTSNFIKHRNQIAFQRCNLILQKLNQIKDLRNSNQDYSQFFNDIVQNIIKDSNQFHAVCLDTYPPIMYLDDFSKQIMYIVDHIFNTNQNLKYKVAYTFDAGPHAFLFIHKDIEKLIFSYFCSLFGLQKSHFNQKSVQLYQQISNQKETVLNKMNFKQYTKDLIKPLGLWITDVGRGAQKVN